jgi:NADH-quinone oxidoreductase subunit J
VILALIGALALVSAASMLVLREPMRVALALITTMTALGAVYGLLGVHFIAAFQVLIYVGAVMVFMVYVIMLLQLREPAGQRRFSKWLIPGVAAGAALSGVLGVAVSRSANAPVTTVTGTSTFGLVQFSAAFLSEYWLEFELTTVLLVSAIVAALAVINVSRRAQATAVPSARPEAPRG